MRNTLHYCKEFVKTNILKTIYLNFKLLPFKKAVKFPFFLYGKVYIGDLSGRVVLPEDITTGMIRIGYRWIDLWPQSFLPTQIQVKGTLEFKGAGIISGGANINVQSKEGILIIGREVIIGGGTICKCLKRISIGNYTRITGNCTIMDCNMHFVKNIDTGIVSDNKAPIFIGEQCWINAGSIVSKGAVIPDYSISSRNAFLSKDFSEFGTNLFLVGSPAKPSSSRVQRFFTEEKQREFNEYFRTHKVASVQLEPGIEIEKGKREGF